MADNFSVLVVDDSNSIRELIISELSELNIKIHQADSGEDAYEIYDKNNIDFIITDINMPNGNGINFLKNIKMLKRSVPPVILISGMIDLSQLELEQLGIIKCFENFLDLVEIKSLVYAQILNKDYKLFA